jgi:hypothetical protein
MKITKTQLRKLIKENIENVPESKTMWAVWHPTNGYIRNTSRGHIASKQLQARFLFATKDAAFGTIPTGKYVDITHVRFLASELLFVPVEMTLTVAGPPEKPDVPEWYWMEE